MVDRSRRPRIRLRVGIAAMFLGIMLPLTGLMTSVLYRQNSHLAEDLARDAMDGATRDVVSGVRGLLVPMARVVNLSSAFGKAEGEKLRRVDSLRPLVETLEAFPDLYALFFGFAKDGAFYEVIRLPPPGAKGLLGRHPPAGARYALRIIDTVEGERVDSWIYITKWGDVAGVERAPKAVYDPRGRGWFKAASEQAGVATSGLHVFSSIGKPGMTLSQRLVTDDGSLIGVFAADLLTDTLSRHLAERAVGSKGRIFILDEDNHLLGHPDPSMSVIQGAKGLEIAAIDRISDRVVADAVRLRGGRGDRFQAPLGGHDETYLVSFSPFPDDFGKRWTIGVVAAESEFVGPLRRASLRIVAIGAVFLILAAACVAWASRLLTRPIEALIAEVRDVEALRLRDNTLIRSSVIEVHALAEAIGRMKEALRSFAAYVPKDLVRGIIAAGGGTTIDGERRPLTILFTDIEGFTKASEFMAPEDVAHRLSIYFEMMSAEILASRGTVDKFIGDAVMALWNAPSLDDNHVMDACRAVLACRAVSEELNRELVANRFPPMPTRFGLHTGSAVVGNVGSSDRMQYTALGAEVNLASRIEGLNKMFGTSILVTGAVEREVRQHFLFRPLGVVAPAGVTQPVPLFELLGALDPAAPHAAAPEQVEACARWVEAMKRYMAQDWEGAAAAFRAYLAHQGEDGPARLYLGLAEARRTDPPAEGWDGVLTFEGK